MRETIERAGRDSNPQPSDPYGAPSNSAASSPDTAVFPDPRLVAAIVDRVTFNSHILETGTQSYRLRTSKTIGRRKSG